MRSFETSYAGIFDLTVDDEVLVTSIEIPLFQRDYAQGRATDDVVTVRTNFLAVLHDAVTGGGPVSLDFVYGEVDEASSKLQPLDGQQRLTALFLLHWYLAARTDRMAAEGSWRNFTYATRPSARDFCEQLGRVSLPPDLGGSPAAWLSDRNWFLPTWKFDPTVVSMLVVIDDIAGLFSEDDLHAAWERLHADDPAISFHFLPIVDMGAPEELYIKMNSRGRPLTDFENLKALLEKAVEGSSVAEAGELAEKLDGSWLNLMWPLRDGDQQVDAQFLNYIRFVIELCELRTGDVEAAQFPLIERTQRAFTTGHDHADENVQFLLDAFDVWAATEDPSFDVPDFFDATFAIRVADAGDDTGQVVIFARDPNPNLFEVCCRHYGNQRFFGSRLRMLLYAVILHRIHDTNDFSRRIRVVRNLLEASEDERRADKLVGITRDVRSIIVEGDLEAVATLNQVQKADEAEKRSFLAGHPALEAVVRRLEDHALLRGSLVAFDLDAERIGSRAALFDQVVAADASLLDLTGALLAVGDYHRTVGKAVPSFRFGAPQWSRKQPQWWRELLTGVSRSDLQPLRTTLAEVLDRLATSDAPFDHELLAIRQEWLDAKPSGSGFDWRYYMVRYADMRSGTSGIYRSDDNRLGFSLYRLDDKDLRSRSRDPYLEASMVLSGASEAMTSTYRALVLNSSELELSSAADGFAIKPPLLDQHRTLFDDFCHGRSDVVDAADGTGRVMLRVPQYVDHEDAADLSDRVEIAAILLKDLVAAGL
jgi:hypothetical protein